MKAVSNQFSSYCCHTKSNKRLKLSHTSDSEEVPSASISDLPTDLLKYYFSFIPGSYIAVAPVSRHFFSNYCPVGVPELSNMNYADPLLKIGRNKTTTEFGVSSVSRCSLEIYSQRLLSALNGRQDIIDCALAYY